VAEPPIAGSAMGETVPKPSPPAEIGVVTARGFSAMAATLQGLFTSRGETIDPVRDAQTTPGAFWPRCDLTGQLVMRAGGCNVGIGWYNASEGATTPPAKSEIYEIVPATFPMCSAVIDPASSCCDDADFCPLAIYDTTQIPQHRWNMASFSAADIRADARYKGGLIGFAVMGASSNTMCSQNKYSQLDLNDKSPSGQAWVGVLVYRATVDPNSYYLAFESLPTAPGSWKGQNGGNDGDFNDFVLYVKGACPEMGMGGATGMAGNAGAPGNGGPGGGGGTPGGSNGAGGGNHAAGGGGDEGDRGGASPNASGGGRGTAGAGAGAGSGAGGAGAAGKGAGGGGGADAGAGGSGGLPGASRSTSSCSCTTTVGEGSEGALAVWLSVALALNHRRRRRA
jgi:hypothetical protein